MIPLDRAAAYLMDQWPTWHGRWATVTEGTRDMFRREAQEVFRIMSGEKAGRADE